MTKWQEWIERYVHEVARRLPRDIRQDVAGELRSLLEDEVEERIAADPQRSAEEVVLERLAELDTPAVMARRYLPTEGGLIGPELLPAFRKTAMIVLGIYGVLAVLWALQIVSTTIHLIPFRFEFSDATSGYDLLTGALANLGAVVGLFALIDWARRRRQPARVAAAANTAWDPHKLPALPAPGRVSRIGHGIGALFGLYILLALNFAPDWLGLLIVRGDEWGPFQILDPAYRAFLPWLNAWLIADLAFEAWLIARGRRDALAHGLEGAIDGFGALVVLRIITGGPFTVFDVLAKPVMGIVAVILMISAISEIARGVRLSRAGRLAGAGAPSA